jgi:hypothetical protein
VSAASYNRGVDAVDWLLDSDPAIRSQTMRDLTDASPAAVATERTRIPYEGLGAEILARQGSDGAWHRSDTPDWLPTLFTLQLLRATGVDRTDPAVEAMVARLEAGFRWDEAFGKKPFFEGEVEPCINGGALALGAYFGRPTESLARRLVGEQLEDGGWNCDAPKSTRSSYHTTICVLEGLLEYERAVGSAPARSQIPRSWSSHSRRATTTTSFARSTTSEPAVSGPTRASLMPCISSSADDRLTAGGFSIARTTRRSTSMSASRSARRVGGIR